ncbi:MAG TPA: hypothetical protein PK453_16710 [Leptospiraceae bacterium]|nr:hypothetical protein [Leptospiraceae bacterium]HNF15312.1 hypothetical protein [Leptospiraceae bacterium]HNI98298.1 hypothetical protein [Leptospiraceae bacterium]HNM06648.1 hypothetical protein [Leptospiraceae bacterium]
MKYAFLSVLLILLQCAKAEVQKPRFYRPALTVSVQRETLEDGKKKISSPITVLGSSRTVEFIYEDGFDDLAEYHLEYAVKIIPKIADYFQTAPTKEAFRITQLRDGSTDRNEGESIYFHLDNQFNKSQRIPTGHPLLFHEIGHWWFGQNPRFMAEGVSSYLPVVLNESGLLQLSEKEMNDIKNWWGFYKQTVIGDVPLGDDEKKELSGEPGFSLNYEKSYKIQYILHKELGAKKYKDFLLSLLDTQASDRNWVLKTQYHHDTESIFNALQNQKKMDWKSLLSGWAGNAGYKKISLKDWQDSDMDGLLDIEERYLGTNPLNKDSDMDGLLDGTEMELGLNPLKAQSKEEVRKIVRDKGPFIDGSPADWDLIENKKTFISAPNRSLKGKYDLIEFHYIIKNNIFYGMMKTREPAAFDSASDKDTYFFINDVTKPKFRDGFGCWYSPTARTGWEYGRSSGESAVPEGRLGEVFEWKIPLSDSDPFPLEFVPIVRNGRLKENLGYWNEYKPIIIEK